MLDLSKYAEDKDSYILRTEVNESFTKFKVIYASGREEEFDFSIHNYQVYLYRMEEQYNRYSKCYKREVGMECNQEMKRAFITSLLDIAGIIFTCSSDFHVAGKIILSFVLMMGVLLNIAKVGKANAELQRKAMKTAIVDAYLEHREEFAINVKDPVNGKEEKWYVIDFNSLDQFNTVFELSLSAMPLKIPEFKEQLERDFNGETSEETFGTISK